MGESHGEGVVGEGGGEEGVEEGLGHEEREEVLGVGAGVIVEVAVVEGKEGLFLTHLLLILILLGLLPALDCKATGACSIVEDDG